MNRYLSIGEVSKIKGVSVKSLRYYDKIGVLTPAYINPDTGYRYYTTQQFFELDLIFVCLELGIPLKSLNSYYDSNNQMNIKKLLNDSQKIASEKIRNIQLGLKKVNRALDSIEDSETYSSNEDIYERRYPERYILTIDIDEKINNKSYELMATKLYTMADEIGATPTYQSGLIYEFNGDEIKKFIFIEVLEHNQSNIIKTIPEGSFLCHRNNHSTIDRSRALFDSIFSSQKRVTVFEMDILQEKISSDNWCFELQVYKPN